MHGEMSKGVTSIKSQEMPVHGSTGQHIVWKQGLKTDPDKVRVILEMQPSTNVTEVNSFLGHIGYYRRFIKNFAKVSYPLDRLICKGESFRWKKE